MKLPTPPSATELATPHFDEFVGIASEYFAQVDPAELIDSITLADLARGSWRPYGFTAIHELPSAEEDERQLRLHVWTTIGLDALPMQIPDALAHRHGAHLGGLAVRDAYSEYLVDTRPATTANEDTFRNFAHHGDTWNDVGLVTRAVHELDVYSQGAAHYIAADQYHMTPITPDPLGLTLVLRGKVFCPSAFLQPIHLAQPAVFPPPEPMPHNVLQAVWNEVRHIQETAD